MERAPLRTAMLVWGSLLALTTNVAPARADTEAGAALSAPEPTLLPRAPIVERGESPRWYRSDPAAGWLAGRVAIGGAGRVSGRADGAAFAAEASLGARLGLERSERWAWALMPEIGYANLALASDSSSHLAMAGLGLGQVFREAAFGILPRFVYGDDGGRQAMGLRTGIFFDGIGEAGIVGEIAHTLLFVDGATAHDVRLVLGLDVTMFFTPRDCHVPLYGGSRAGCRNK